MKKDARNFLNKRKWKSQTVSHLKNIFNSNKSSSNLFDARKIINSRHGKQQMRVNHKNIAPFKKKVPFTPKIGNGSGLSHGQNSSKRVKMLPDGNLFITAHSQKTVVKKWEPSELDTEDLEHVTINDLVDMESLPSAFEPSVPFQSNQGDRSLSAEILSVQNTMIADQLNTKGKSSVKVHVNNLKSTVSRQDIVELFSDVGPIKNIELPHSGTAIIEYFEAKDAQNAYEIYNDRLLDGEPMRCYIDNILPLHKPLVQRLGHRMLQSSTLQPSSSIAHRPHNARLQYNPRDVRFTVKL